MKFNCALIIEDDDTSSFLTQRILAKMNVSDKIELAMNGEKGLNFINYYAMIHDNECPELIFLDINMPVFDGDQFLEYFKRKEFKNKDRIKLIVTTSIIGMKHEIILEKFPDVNIIKKPVTSEKLKNVLGKRLQ